MKIFLLLVSLFISSNHWAIAQSGHVQLPHVNPTVKVFIAINPTECTACINTLQLIQNIDRSISIQFVFQESYKDDSATVVKNFFLKKYQVGYKWSDSLYNQFITKGSISSLSAVSSSSKKKITIPLKTFNSKFVEWLNRYASTIDTITYNEKIVSQGTYKIKWGNGNIYLLNTVKNEVCVFDDVSRDKKYAVQMPDSAIYYAYTKKLGNEAYFLNQKLLLQLEVPQPNVFRQFNICGDTVVTISEHSYFTIQGKDTFLNSFNTLDKFYNGNWLTGINIEDEELYGGKKGYIINTNSFYYDKGKFLLGMLGPQGEEVQNYFLAEFIEKDGKYNFKNFLEIYLPEVYKDYVSAFQDCIFDDDYFCLSLGDRIYSVKDHSFIDIGIFPGKINKDGDPYYYSRSMIDFKIYDGVIYFIYWDGDLNSQMYGRYNISQKALMEKAPIPDITFQAQIDKFDPNYINVPLDKTRFLRRKMGLAEIKNDNDKPNRLKD